MQTRSTDFPPPKALALPLKDALRGLRMTADRSRAAFGPLLALIPGPAGALPRTVDAAASWARSATTRAVRTFDPTAADITTSGLAAIAASPEPELLFAEAAYRGLSDALRALGEERFLISQTLAAYAWASLADASNKGAVRAADLMVAMSEHHVVGPAPGTPLGLGETERSTIRMAAFATMLWLLAERVEPLGDEVELRAIAVDMALALRQEIEAAGDDPSALAALFATYAEVL